ncbi:MAG: transposase [Alphaproteobacteria bacterium]|nr:transposase [Alphaproteobacteria bacterium]
MGRAWRIEYEGGLYHVLSRGNERNDIFRDDHDRQTFLDVIGEMADRYVVDVYAYVFMNNHYHMLLRTNQANLSKSMQWLAVTYTRRFNNRHSRSGHLFQGRFKSIIVQNDAYLMRLSCYIHRNPLRAGVVSRLAQHPWSSYKVYAYGAEAPEWLVTKPILDQIQADDKHKAYREKVQRYAVEEKRLWEDFRHGLIIGTQEFVDKIRLKFMPDDCHREIPQQRAMGKSVEPEKVLKKAAKILNCDLDLIRDSRRIPKSIKDDRDLLVYLVRQGCMLTNEETGRLFGMTYSAVSRILSSMRARIQKESDLRYEYNRIYSLCKM